MMKKLYLFGTILIDVSSELLIIISVILITLKIALIQMGVVSKFQFLSIQSLVFIIILGALAKTLSKLLYYNFNNRNS